ncbi:MAG: hypothetical protein M1480_13935 [Bacteroidetes bacterium]|nr:hypothetical protein [Bacteroidota bacterium]
MGLKFLTVFILIFSVAYPQMNPGAKQISLSYSDVALTNDVFGLFNNPASLAKINWREAGVYYSPAPFGFTEMANGYIAYNEPFDWGSLALGGMNYGFELYKENKILVGCSYNYADKFLIGVVFNYHSVSIKNYGSANSFYLNLGGIIPITDFVNWGFSIHNINRATFGKAKDQIPTVFKTGFNFCIAQNISLNAAFEKDIIQESSLMFGINYDIIKYISIRTGFSNEPSRFTAGVGINYLYFTLDYAVFTHPDLGLTHQAGLIISLEKEKLKK